MKSYYTKKEREDRRARCIKYLLKYGNLPAARKASSRVLKTFVKDRSGHDRRYAVDMSKQIGRAHV